MDGVGGVALVAGVGYVEFTQFDALPKGQDGAKATTSHRVSMSLDTMLRLHQALTGATTQLEERGVIKRKEGAADGTDKKLIPKGEKQLN